MRSTYLTARQAFAAAIERDAGAMVFEIAKSEMAYTDQRPAEYAAVILAAALRSGWQGPVFLQGDHFQFNATKWRDDPDAEMAGLKDLTREAIDAGFLNIDIDSSTLVDLSQPAVAAQQAVNAANTVELTLLIRDLQPDGVVIGIGGEIGEVGKSNSTEEELRAYLDGYYSLHPRLRHARASARSASRPEQAMAASRCPTGRSREVSIDFDTLRRLSTVARDEYGLAGCVQHGASTLPDEAFHHFPANGTAEIHLATGFQNILYDEPGLPADIRAEMMELVPGQLRAVSARTARPNEQFLYKTRKKAIGPFKRQLWTLPNEAQAQISANLHERFGILFDALHVGGTRALVDRYVTPPALPRPLPPALGGAGRTAVPAGSAVFEDDGSGE